MGSLFLVELRRNAVGHMFTSHTQCDNQDNAALVAGGAYVDPLRGTMGSFSMSGLLSASLLRLFDANLCRRQRRPTPLIRPLVGRGPEGSSYKSSADIDCFRDVLLVLPKS